MIFGLRYTGKNLNVGEQSFVLESGNHTSSLFKKRTYELWAKEVFIFVTCSCSLLGDTLKITTLWPVSFNFVVLVTKEIFRVFLKKMWKNTLGQCNAVRAHGITFWSVTISVFLLECPWIKKSAREHLIVKIKLCPWTLGSAREHFQKIVPVNHEKCP